MHNMHDISQQRSFDIGFSQDEDGLKTKVAFIPPHMDV